jgi:transcriptional regulator with XRE-family HTH domain
MHDQRVCQINFSRLVPFPRIYGMITSMASAGENIDTRDPRRRTAAYLTLMVSIWQQRGVSFREMERITGITRKRLAAIHHGAPTTTPEAEALFDALEINRLQAFLAADQFGDPEEYFTPVAQIVAMFGGEFAFALREAVAESGIELELVGKSLLASLARNVADRILRHQEMIDAKRNAPID